MLDADQDVVVQYLITEIEAILQYAADREQHFEHHLEMVHAQWQESACNLLHYLALRSFDIQELQGHLASLGLSSLGRTEAHVMASLQAVLNVLYRLSGSSPVPSASCPVGYAQGRGLLVAHTEALFGENPDGRHVRIMVTLPSEAAADDEWVRSMVRAGMDCVRINCAHDGEEVWARMIEHVRRAQRETGRPCRILMDLGGPKLRTGTLEPGPRVVHLKPHRDLQGRVEVPARIWLAPPGVPEPDGPACDGTLPVDEGWLARTEVGDDVRFRDARGKKRTLKIIACHGVGRWAELHQSVYVETGTALTIHKQGAGKKEHGLTSPLGTLPPLEQPIILKKGEMLLLGRDLVPGRRAERDEQGRIQAPARIACTMPQVFADVQVGEVVRFDDGKMEGVVRAVSEEALYIEITHAKESGSKLRADRSINFPESKLRITGLTAKDLVDLDFVAQHADLVGLSFVNQPDDVHTLQQELTKRNAGHLGIILKIETQRGFEQLPELLLTAMRSYPLGVMIARGDLAVEVGWERLAEVQEEILWLCEAAHVPVVWATQVLENLAKTGVPSRAEITDAAMAERAECVMLNKGPHILKAIHALDGILGRMQAHQHKKTSMLRSLFVAKMA